MEHFEDKEFFTAFHSMPLNRRCGLGQMLTKCLQHHQGYPEPPKSADVICEWPLTLKNISRFILFLNFPTTTIFDSNRLTSPAPPAVTSTRLRLAQLGVVGCCYRVLWSCGAAAVLLRCCGAVECGVTDTHIYLVTGMGDTCDNSRHYNYRHNN